MKIYSNFTFGIKFVDSFVCKLTPLFVNCLSALVWLINLEIINFD